MSDSTKTYNDGKVHLEFRHNANADFPTFNRWGLASFNLKSLETSSSGQVGLVIHTNEFGSQANAYALTYKYGSEAELGTTRNINIGESKAVIQ